MDVGDRVELIYTSDEYTSLVPGDTGTITKVDIDRFRERPVKKYWVDWDDGGRLAMIQGEDEIKKIGEVDDG